MSWKLKPLLILTVAGSASCTSEEETASFSVMEPGECGAQQLIIIEDFDRPGATALTNIAREQARLANSTCPTLRSIKIQHFFEGDLWYVEANGESGWNAGDWQRIPLGEREKIVLEELDLMRRYLAEQRQNPNDTSEKD